MKGQHSKSGQTLQAWSVNPNQREGNVHFLSQALYTLYATYSLQKVEHYEKLKPKRLRPIPEAAQKMLASHSSSGLLIPKLVPSPPPQALWVEKST